MVATVQLREKTFMHVRVSAFTGKRISKCSEKSDIFQAIYIIMVLYVRLNFSLHLCSFILHVAFANLVFMWSAVVCSKSPSLDRCSICQSS